MPRRIPRPRPALEPRSLRDLGLSYAARFATTRAKLIRYLLRKLDERGWEGAVPANPAAVADEFVTLGYIDDAAFADTRASALTRRGFGPRRIGQALGQAGIEAPLREATVAAAGDGAFAAAVSLARRRRFGPFGDGARDPAVRQKQIAALLRAGHDYGHARRIVGAESVEMLDNEE